MVPEPRGGQWSGWSSSRWHRTGHRQPGDAPNAHAVPRDWAEGRDDKRLGFSPSTGPCPKFRPTHVINELFAVKSYLTSWCNQNLSRRVLKGYQRQLLHLVKC